MNIENLLKSCLFSYFTRKPEDKNNETNYTTNYTNPYKYLNINKDKITIW